MRKSATRLQGLQELLNATIQSDHLRKPNQLERILLERLEFWLQCPLEGIVDGGYLEMRESKLILLSDQGLAAEMCVRFRDFVGL